MSRRSLRGLRVSHPEDLAVSLHHAAGAKLAGAFHVNGRTVVLSLEWQGHEVKFQADISDVWAAPIPEFPVRGRALQPAQAARVAGRRDWTYEELEAAGLPLYWSKEWFDSALERLGTMDRIAKEYGYKPLAVWSYAKRVYGYRRDKRQVLAREKYEKARECYQRGMTYEQIRKEVGTNPRTVCKWVKRFKAEGIVPPPRADWRRRRRGRGDSPLRRAILIALSDGPKSSSAIAAETGYSKSGVKVELWRLKDEGRVVGSRARGNNRVSPLYSLAVEEVAA